METYQKIIRGVGSVPFPYRDRDPEATDLVKQLLRHCPSERLPMKSGGTDNLKKHPWYSSFDWKGLEKGDIKPPYVPEVYEGFHLYKSKVTNRNRQITIDKSKGYKNI